MVEEKYKAVELAHHTTNTFAAKTYSLDLTMPGRWEAQLYKWIMELHKDGFAVNYSSIKIKMAKIIKLSLGLAQEDAKKSAINNFKLSQHWLTNTHPPPASVVVWFQDKGWIDESGMDQQI
ncbi:34970_t:CDS:2, partial [Gigaspora margarita]